MLRSRFIHLEKQIANLQKESLTQLRARLAEVRPDQVCTILIRKAVGVWWQKFSLIFAKLPFCLQRVQLLLYSLQHIMMLYRSDLKDCETNRKLRISSFTAGYYS